MKNEEMSTIVVMNLVSIPYSLINGIPRILGLHWYELSVTKKVATCSWKEVASENPQDSIFTQMNVDIFSLYQLRYQHNEK